MQLCVRVIVLHCSSGCCLVTGASVERCHLVKGMTGDKHYCNAGKITGTASFRRRWGAGEKRGGDQESRGASTDLERYALLVITLLHDVRLVLSELNES